MKSWHRFRRSDAGVAALVAALTLCLLEPSLSAGFVGDDIFSANVRAFGDAREFSPIATIRAVAATGERLGSGYVPLDELRLAFWYARPSDVLARIVQYAIVACDVTLFTLLVARRYASRALAALAGTSVLAMIEFRLSGDPVLERIAGPSVAIALLLGAFLLLEAGERRHGAARYVAAAVAAASAVAFDQSAVFGVFAALALARHPRGLVPGALAVVLAPSCVVAGAALLGHLPSHALLAWFDPASLPARLGSAAGHVLAVVPGFPHADPALVATGRTGYDADRRYIALPHVNRPLLGAIGAAVGVVAVAVGRAVRSPAVVASPLFPIALVAAGALGDDLALLGDLGFGLGVALAIRALGRLRGVSSPVAATCAGALAGIVLYGNARVDDLVVTLDRTRHDVRRALAEAGRSGFFDALPAEAFVVPQLRYPVVFAGVDDYRDVRYLLYEVAHRRFSVGKVSERLASRDAWLLRRGSLEQAMPNAVVLERLDAGSSLRTSRALAFRRFDSLAVARAAAATFVADRRGVRTATLLRSTSVVQTADRRCGSVALDDAFSASGPGVRYETGFVAPTFTSRYDFALGLAPSEGQSWRFGSDGARLAVHEDPCRPGRLRFSAFVETVAPATVRLTVGARSVAVLQTGAGGDYFDVVLPSNLGPAFDLVVRTPGAPTAPGVSPATPSFRTPPAAVTFLIDTPTVTVDPSSGDS